jgi:hypothetical protein
MTATKRPQVNFRPQDDLLDALGARAESYEQGTATGLAPVAERDLGRYYALLERDLRAVDLTEREALALADNHTGTLWEAWSATPAMLAANVEDDPDLGARWSLDQAALIAKLRALTPGQALAVIDAVERAWRRDEPDMAGRLRAAGLVRDGH